MTPDKPAQEIRQSNSWWCTKAQLTLRALLSAFQLILSGLKRESALPVLFMVQVFVINEKGHAHIFLSLWFTPFLGGGCGSYVTQSVVGFISKYNPLESGA